MFLSSWQHFLYIWGKRLTETTSTKTNHNSYAGGRLTCSISKAHSSPSLRSAFEPCSGTHWPISEWQSPLKEAGCSLWWENKGAGGHCSPEVSCRWEEKPDDFLLLYDSEAFTPTLRSPHGTIRRADSMQSWFLISLLTSELFSPARSTVAFFHHYLDMSLFQQRFIAVGRRVRNDDSIVLTFGSKTFIQQDTGRDKG